MILFEVQPNPALRTPHFHRQFDLSLGKEISYIFTKFNPLNNTLRQYGHYGLAGFDCTTKNARGFRLDSKFNRHHPSPN